MYTRYLITPGVEFADGGFVPKASPADADELLEDECMASRGCGRIAYALMGYDPEGEQWEYLMAFASPSTLVRRIGMMLGVELEWLGLEPMQFESPCAAVGSCCK